MFVKITDLSFGYHSNFILRGIRMSLEKGEVVSIVGPNGAGKTTLLKSIASILPPKKGKVWIDGKDVYSLKRRDLAKIQAYVLQHAASGFPLTVMETVMLGRKPYIRWGVTSEDLHIVGKLLSDLHLDCYATRYVDELSGGERQKVLIARALAQQPDLLLLDEPTSALDIRHQLEVLELVRKLAKHSGILVILILHDLELAARYSDRIYMLKDGQVFTSGRPEEVFTCTNMERVYGVKMEIVSETHGLKMTAIEPVET
ncbi:ABC transporter ATP-binding protein [Paenibacillus sp. p3-SID867]|uniref:ABC transporter ATP-binding protein n=1 Tax=Paenibacillus sp. p3-SID867 TaxID=2916363 RepID=UPI0021A4C9F1|nr:ABC transporter ATP-binding protein [Paenibacillus sp. p3-SID867]MCT1402995.1 ABC transporter ATP-binding protein [Paenibacillus sp. p3-SID867]